MGYTDPVPDEGERMTEEKVVHEGNETPEASDEGIKRVDQDNPQPDSGDAVEGHGVGANPTDSTDPEENQDPKSGHSPV
jgi:hypothetical protein